MSEKKDVVSKEKLLEAGSYFGHHASTWNPKMKPFIHMKRKKTHIIDLAKTSLAINFAYDLIRKFTQKKASFIFVGTRPNAKETIKYNALRTNSFYVSERWLGGTLTNHRTILSRVKKLEELEEKEKQNYSGYTKKEGVMFAKELAKLHRNLDGIREMKFKPQVMIIADPMHDEIAVHEAKKSGVKIIGIVDTNCDPTLVDVAIPANDDSIKSVTLIITLLADAIAQEKGGVIDFAFKNDEEIILPADPIREKKEQRSFRPEDGQRFNRSGHENHSSNYKDSKSRFSKSDSKGFRSKENYPRQKNEKEDGTSESKLSHEIEKMTIAELHKTLDEKKIEYKSSDKKADLIKLLGGN